MRVPSWIWVSGLSGARSPEPSVNNVSLSLFCHPLTIEVGPVDLKLVAAEDLAWVHNAVGVGDPFDLVHER